MKVRSFHTKIWNDKFFSKLTPTEKLLFIYYVFNPRVNIIYCYECHDQITKFETGLSQDILDTGKKKFSGANKILFYEDYVFLVNGRRYQFFSGPKNDTARDTLLKEMGKSVKSWFNSVSDTPIYTPLIPSETEIKIETETKYETKRKRNEDVDPRDLPEESWLAWQKKNKI